METRSLQSQWSNEGNRLAGSIPYNSPTTIYERGRRWTEIVRPGAFRNALDSKGDIIATFNHNPDRLLGRTSAGTLRLNDGPDALRFEIDLPAHAEDVREMIQRGDLKGASFTFGVRKGGETWSQDRSTRELNDLYLSELGPVASPAYSESSVQLRSADADWLVLMQMAIDLAENEARSLNTTK